MAKRKADPLAQISTTARMKALIGGWNARDPLPDMPPGDAVILQNFIPGLTGVSVRPGSTTTLTGIGGPVNSLMNYNGPTTGKLFAASGHKIYDVSGGGVVGAAVVTGLGNDVFRTTMFSTPAPASYLVPCNGVDGVQLYDGNVWTTPSITGAMVNPFTIPAAIANRLFFIEANTLHVWYLGVGAISGAASLFDLGQQCHLGGRLVAMASWSQDGGNGPQDYACFFTSAGEVIVYQGTDPSDATKWSLVGRFRIPPPVGNNSVVKAGSDLAIITTLGVVPLTAVLVTSMAGQSIGAITDKIKGAFQTAVAATGALAGWQIVEYPFGAIILVNVPQADGTTFQQYVMSAVTGAWCNFTNLNATSWSLFGSLLYFGDANGNVHLYDVANNDDGQPIPFTALPAFTDFSGPTTPNLMPGGNRQLLMARASFTAVPGTAPPVSGRFDYDNSVPILAQPPTPIVGAMWDVSPWDTTPWGATTTDISLWQSVEGMGQVASILVAGNSLNALTLNHIDVILQSGGEF